MPLNRTIDMIHSWYPGTALTFCQSLDTWQYTSYPVCELIHDLSLIGFLCRVQNTHIIFDTKHTYIFDHLLPSSLTLSFLIYFTMMSATHNSIGFPIIHHPLFAGIDNPLVAQIYLWFAFTSSRAVFPNYWYPSRQYFGIAFAHSLKRILPILD